MADILVIAERDSVCLGDDIDVPHTCKFKVEPTLTLQDVIHHLLQKRYLPSVNGEKHIWSATINTQTIATILGNNNFTQATDMLSKPAIDFLVDGKLELYFIYQSSTH